MKAEVIVVGVLSMQVCVPEEWTDQEVKEFADRVNLCGTQNGWQIRKDGDFLKLKQIILKGGE